jgi:hypothetical protein
MRSLSVSKLIILATALVPGTTLAANFLDQGANDAGSGTGLSNSLPHFFSVIANTLIYIVGAVAVIMLIIGGFRYVISQGDAGSVKQAKDTILYGIIGIIVAIIAYALVTFLGNTLK